MRRLALLLFALGVTPVSADDLRADARSALKRAGTYFAEEVATKGGYVYHYTEDLSVRWGEGKASPDQIWVQPPGTPTVGMAFVKIWRTTKDPAALEAATEAAVALVYGQLRSGGWTNAIDFDPDGERVSLYRIGKGRGRNYSTLDDGATQAALQLLMRVDEAHEFENEAVSEAVKIGLDALLAAQLSNGGFPQVWEEKPTLELTEDRASFPDYAWSTEHRIKEYWHLPTLNDGLAGTVAATLIEAHETYGDKRFMAALKRLGDFLLAAQMPEPQPAWAQQYTPQMRPAWGRNFEPPAIASHESEDVLKALIEIARATKDPRYLKPIPRAIEYLRSCALPDGRLARYYELETNRSLYMELEDNVYWLTHHDTDLPSHYGWKIEPELDEIEAAFKRRGDPQEDILSDKEIRRIVAALDDKGRWLSTAKEGQRFVGQAKIKAGDRYLSSAVFAKNAEAICDWLGRR